MKKRPQEGFTLIELMIVVAIIGILASIALPAYQDFIIRSQVTEGPSLSSEIKTTLSDSYGAKGIWPADNAALGFVSAISGSYVASVISAGGAITVTYGNKANAASLAGRILTLRPAPNANGDIAWVCGNAATPAGHAVVGANATTVLGKHLPSPCR